MIYNDMLNKIFRYIFLIILIWIGVSFIANGKLNIYDIITIVLFVMASFIFIDIYYPVVYY